MLAGIVCEYNPFHNGHLYHIEKTKEKADGIVCVMSGNFVQRGECAFTDKWLRAETAIKCGADVVIDLPLPWSCASAGTFARGSVGLLGAFGVDMLSFGSESEDIGLLKACALLTEKESVREEIRRNMSKGMTYPFALSEAAKTCLSEKAAEILTKPNSTLACEYMRNAEEMGLSLHYLPVKRAGTDHDSESTADFFASASKIRSMPLSESEIFLPEVCREMLKNATIYSMKNNERGILSALREMSPEEYELYTEDGKGLSNRIREKVKRAKSLEELYDSVKTKSYTHSKIRREIMGLYLKIPAKIREGIPPYIRILAVSEKGLSLLGEAKRKSSLPIITKHSEAISLDEKERELYALQCSSSDKFALFSEDILPCGTEQTKSMLIVKN